MILTEEALYKKSPQEITALLYEACLMNLEEAMTEMNKNNHVIANLKLQKVNDILYRLGAGLNYEKGGIIADQLDALYNYMADRVIEANLKKDSEMIEEVIRLLETISAAWNESLKNKSQSNALQQKTMLYEQNILTEK